MKKSLLALAVIALASVVLVLWFALGTETPRETADAGPRLPEATPTQAPELAEVAPASNPEPDARATVEPASAASREERLRADAQWVEVEVELPPNTPTDEQLSLIAVGFAPDRFPTEDAAREALSSYRQRQENGGWFAPAFKDAPVMPDELVCERTEGGSFRAPFPSGSKVGLLRLSARYVYPLETTQVELPSERVRIATKVGAWLTARLVLPASLPADVDPSAIEPFDVSLNGWSMGGGDNHGTRAKAGPGLEFEFGGLHPGLTYFVSAEPPQFANLADANVAPQAGEHLERTYALKLGARIRGVVLDAGGTPLADAHVGAEASKRSMFGFGGGRNATTGADGAFALRGVPAGKLKLRATSKGATEALTDEFEVVEGETREGLELRLGAGKTLAGRVQFADGSAAVDAVVSVTERTAGEARRGRPSSSTEQIETDAEGRFSLGGLTAEQVEVVAGLEREVADGDGKRKETLRSARTAATVGVELSLVLEPPHVVRGRAVDDLGEPIAIFTINKVELLETEEDWRNPRTVEVFKDERGAFALSLPSGKWELSVEAEAHATSDKQRITLPGEHAELLFSLPRAVALAGIVLDPGGAPLARAKVNAGRAERRGSFERGGDDVDSDAQGRFRFESIAPGGVTLSATHAEFAPSEPASFELVAGQPLTDVELRLRVGGRLEGEIFDATGAGAPGRQIIVGNFGMGDGNIGGNATSDAAGRFTVEHLAPGKYNVIATPPMDQLANAGEDFDQAQMMASLKMTSVEIRDGETSHVVLGAPPKAPVRITGRVTSGGEPFNEGMLMVIAEGKSMLDSLKMVKLESDGRYALTVDGAGDYSFIVGTGMGDDHSAEFSETVPEVEEHVIDFAVPLGGIRGRVVARDGKALESIPVSVALEGGSSLLLVDMGRQISTDAEGNFEFKRLKPGNYTIRAGAGRFDSFRETALTHSVAVRSGFEVKADRVLEGVEIRLDTPGVIEGTVVDADGKPVSRAAVFVRNSEGRVLNPVSTCISDGLGKFKFDGAAPGSYTVSARSGQLASRDATSVRVVAEAKNEIEVRLEPGTVLRISVADENDKLIRASLRVVDDSGREVSGLFGADAIESLMTEGFSTTEQRVGPLPSGKYKVTATASDGASVTKSVTLTGNEERFLRIKLKD